MSWIFDKNRWDPRKTIYDNAVAMNIPYHTALAGCKHNNLSYVIRHQSPVPLQPENKESLSLWEIED